VPTDEEHVSEGRRTSGYGPESGEGVARKRGRPETADQGDARIAQCLSHVLHYPVACAEALAIYANELVVLVVLAVLTS
jgi:hypothetical protein